MSIPLAGTMIVPGVSLNNRLYTPEAIGKAFARLTERLADPAGLPVAMLTHHAAGDDSTRIVARVDTVTLNPDTGGIDYTGHTADTAHAQTIESLVDAEHPFLQNVSIRGYWATPPKTITYQGQTVETADDMEIDGLDFTKDPGVLGATVRAMSAAPTETSTGGRFPIVETAPSTRALFTETRPTKVVYADNGYRGGVKRLPVDTAEHAHRSAGRLVETADQYTAPQLKRIRHRIRAAPTTFGETMTAPTTTETVDTAPTFGESRLGDVTECYGDGGASGFSISIYNGPLTVSVSAYYGIDPADLGAVAAAAMDAAVTATHAMDPDDDADVDTGTSETTSTGAASAVTESAPTEKEAAPVATPETPTTTAPAVTETDTTGTEVTAPAAPAAPAAVLTQADVDAAVAAALAAHGITDTAPVETAPTGGTVTETDGRSLAELVAEAVEARVAKARDEIIAEARANSGGLGKRKGLVEKLAAESGGKPLHEMNDEEFRAHTAKAWTTVLPAHLTPEL